MDNMGLIARVNNGVVTRLLVAAMLLVTVSCSAGSAGSAKAGERAWLSEDFRFIGDVSGPAITEDGTVFVAQNEAIKTANSRGNQLNKFTAASLPEDFPEDITYDWEIDSEEPIHLDDDGNVYLSNDGYILSADSSLDFRWYRSITNMVLSGSGTEGSWRLGGSALAIDAEGNSFFGTEITYVRPDEFARSLGLELNNGNTRSAFLFSLSSEGEVNWRVAIGRMNPAEYPPAIDANGVVYFAALNYGPTVLALDAENGETLWTWHKDGGGNVSGQPAIGPDGTIYIAADTRSGATIYALAPDGSLKWETVVDSQDYSTMNPVVAADGTIYLSTKNLVSINSDGDINWIKEGYYNYPIVLAGGQIAVTDEMTYEYDKIAVFNPDGTLDWTYPAEDADETELYLTAPPITDQNGNLYVFNNDEFRESGLLAIGTGTSGIDTQAPWPAAGGNRQRSGRVMSR